jgi:phosphocarrier protein
VDISTPGKPLARIAGSALLNHEGGLHARPSIKVTQLAKRFQSAVWIGALPEGPWIDAKSVASVMAMKLSSPRPLHFAAEGPDAAAAVDALVKLVESDFASA